MLKDYGTGWRNAFEKRIEELLKLFPELRLNSIKRYSAMLRLDFLAPSDDIQYIAKCVAYYIERQSATTCELCGKYGMRRTGDERLPEPKCLCLTCYALELDKALANQ